LGHTHANPQAWRKAIRFEKNFEPGINPALPKKATKEAETTNSAGAFEGAAWFLSFMRPFAYLKPYFLPASSGNIW
jgi:hypothetical protein